MIINSEQKKLIIQHCASFYACFSFDNVFLLTYDLKELKNKIDKTKWKPDEISVWIIEICLSCTAMFTSNKLEAQRSLFEVYIAVQFIQLFIGLAATSYSHCLSETCPSSSYYCFHIRCVKLLDLMYHCYVTHSSDDETMAREPKLTRGP